MLKIHKKYLFYFTTSIFSLYIMLYALMVITTPPSHFAIPNVLSGSLKIKEVRIGPLSINSEDDCSIFQKSLIAGYRGYPELLKKPFHAFGGHIITNDGLKLRMTFNVCKEKQNIISISFNNMENEFYIVELPQSIADALYDKIK